MELFESCLNELIANNFKKANEAFLENYYRNPDKIELFYGVMISYVLLGKIGEFVDFAQKETDVSPLSQKIAFILEFIKLNSQFNNMNSKSIILNSGIFLNKNGLIKDAKLFFRVCNILEPENKKALTALGECAFLENNIEKGVRLFSRAAKKWSVTQTGRRLFQAVPSSRD